MIKDLSFTDDEIKFTIELTTPACPLKEQLENDCRNAIAQLISNEVKVFIDFTSRVTTLRDIKSDILPTVKILSLFLQERWCWKINCCSKFSISIITHRCKSWFN